MSAQCNRMLYTCHTEWSFDNIMLTFSAERWYQHSELSWRGTIKPLSPKCWGKFWGRAQLRHPEDRAFFDLRKETRFPSLCPTQPAGAAPVPIPKVWWVCASSLCSEASYSCRTCGPWRLDHCNWPNENIQRLYRSGWLLTRVCVL